jgi:hypothetical protein
MAPPPLPGVFAFASGKRTTETSAAAEARASHLLRDILSNDGGAPLPPVTSRDAAGFKTLGERPVPSTASTAFIPPLINSAGAVRARSEPRYG